MIQRREKRKNARKEFKLTPQRLLYNMQDGQRKLMVSMSLQQHVLKSYHDDPTTGHIGIHQLSYSWKKMSEDVKAYVHSCPVCQMMKSDHRKQEGPL